MTVVAAVDRSDRAKRIITEVDKLAQAFDLPLHIVHVTSESAYDPYDEGRQGRVEDDIDEERIIADAEAVVQDAIAELDIEGEPVGLIGDPPDQLLTYAEENDAAYIVLAARKRSPIGKAVFGSVAQSVILNAECSVVSAGDL